LVMAAQLNPAHASQYYFNSAAILANTGRCMAAAGFFRLAIDAAPDDPSNAETYYQHALCLMKLASLGPDGRISPPPGMVEAFQKYRELTPNGANVDTANRMLARLQDTIETQYRSPAIPTIRPHRIEIDGSIKPSKLILKSQVAPVYAPDARTARVTGVVQLHAIIGSDGTVWELTVSPDKGHPFLIPAAIDTVKRWVYEPITADGTPVEVETTIVVNFQFSL